MITIREMTNQDVLDASKTMCSCYRWLGVENGFTAKQVDFLVSERGAIETIQEESESQFYLVAEMNSSVVGVAAVKGNEVAKLFVDPSYHGQGIGGMLFDSAEQIIRKAKFKEMIVGVMAYSAIGFYEKMGMSIFEEKILDTGTFAGGKIPLMRKVLCHA